MTGDIPAIQYTYVCQDGDAKRFTRDGLRRYYRHSRRPWIVLAVQALVFVGIALLTGWWWLLVLVPLTLALAIAIDVRNVGRRFRTVAAPGTEWASGFDDKSFIIVDGGALTVVDYANVTAMRRMDDGYLLVRTNAPGVVVFPPELSPAAAEEAMRAGVSAASTR
ncbi:MAG: hypothetical protein QM728_13030 [Gordonia sp. (in: high G+C Gram-positive bacteria)]|uniref:hypothetical protein n=1 Tax=Gordonia sp. (in: high G+C Gram-positive bacteria) TaxID=84139 RepID=UPI0039E2D6A4